MPQPLIGDDVERWRQPRSAAALRAAGIKTLADLTLRAPRRRRWWVTVPGFGATGARQIEVFFAAHPELTQRARALVAVASPQDLSPWENLVVPEEFDGSRGIFRAPRPTRALAGVNYPWPPCLRCRRDEKAVPMTGYAAEAAARKFWRHPGPPEFSEIWAYTPQPASTMVHAMMY